MKILSAVAFAVFFIAASHTPVQAGEKLPFFQMSSPENGTPVQTEIVPMSKAENGVKSVVYQCGVPPGGAPNEVVCDRTEYDDGSECVILYTDQGYWFNPECDNVH